MAQSTGSLPRSLFPASALPSPGNDGKQFEMNQVTVSTDEWNEGNPSPVPNGAERPAPTENDHLLAGNAAAKMNNEPEDLTARQFFARPSVCARLAVMALGVAATGVSMHMFGAHHTNDADSHSMSSTQIASFIGFVCGSLMVSVPGATLLSEGSSWYHRSLAEQ